MRTLVTCIGLLTLFVIGISSCTRTAGTATEVPFKEAPVQEIYGVNMMFTADGIPRSHVRTAKMLQQKENEILNLSGGVTIIFLDTLGNRSGFMLAKRADVDEFRNYYRAYEEVYVWSDSSRMALDTKSLQWNPQTRRISTTDSVRLTTQQDTLYGVGLLADEGLTYWEILQPYGRTYREMQPREPNRSRR